MKKILLLLICLVIESNQKSFSQAQHKVDSLLGVLKTAKEDTNKVNALIDLGRNGWQTGNYEDAKKYAFEAMKLSRKINFRKGEAIAYTISGTADMYTGDYEESLKNQSIALKISEEIGFKTGTGNAYNNIALVYMLQGKYYEAEKYYHLALKVRQEVGDKAKVAATYNNLGILYEKQGKYASALKSYFTYLKVMQETGDKRGIADATMNIGLIYNRQDKNEEALKFSFEALKISQEIEYKAGIGNSQHNIGMVYYDMYNLALALHHQLISLKMFEEIGNKSGMGVDHLSIGNIYTDMGRLDVALKEFFTALKIFQEIGNADNEAIVNNAIGFCYFKQNELDNAINYYNKGILLAREIGADNTLREGYRQLSETYGKKDDFKNAYKYHMLFTNMNDSIFNETKNKQIEEMKTKYETEKKDAEIALLNKDKEVKNAEIKKQKSLKYSFIGGLALFSILSFFIYTSVRTKQKLKLQTLRNKIASDLHDDVGSTLSSIALFSDVAKEQSKEVMPMLQNIGDSSRKMLESMADIVWTINPENDNFEKIILRMRSFAYELLGAKKIDFDFKADDAVTQMKLSMEARKNLYLIFKEAINNMVKYSEANRASFSITGNKNNLTMLVRDNGKGFDINKLTQGNGLKNMKKRAEEIGAQLLIESETGNGTTIQLILKAA